MLEIRYTASGFADSGNSGIWGFTIWGFTMKHFMKTAIGGATLLVASATSGAQAADVDQYNGLIAAGVAEFFVGYRNQDSTDYANSDGPTFGLNGHFSMPFSNSMSFQADLQFEGYYGPDEYEPEAAYAAGGHLSYRDPHSFLVGIFGAASNGSNETDEEPADVGFIVGGEFQIYLDNLTLYAQGGYGDAQIDPGEPEGFVEGWFVRGVGRYFMDPDTMIEAEVSYGETDQYVDGDDKGEIWNWGIKYKQRVAEEMPLYGFVAYRGGHYDATTEDDDGTEHAVLAGISFQWGATTLLQNDRYGANLDMPMLPARASAWAEALD